MSLRVSNCQVIGRQIHHGAEEDTVYLKGRILTVTGPNPSYDPTKPTSEKNRVELVEQIPMTVEGLRLSKHCSMTSNSPLEFHLNDDCEVDVPTGVKYENVNKEHHLNFRGPAVITHGAKVNFKKLDSFLV